MSKFFYLLEFYLSYLQIVHLNLRKNKLTYERGYYAIKSIDIFHCGGYHVE